MRLIRPLTGFKAEGTNRRLSAQPKEEVSMSTGGGKWKRVCFSKRRMWVNVFREPSLALSSSHYPAFISSVICERLSEEPLEPASLTVVQKGSLFHRAVLSYRPRKGTSQNFPHPHILQPAALLSSIVGGSTSASPDVRFLGSEHAR